MDISQEQLISESFKRCKIDKKLFFIKYLFNETSYCVIITDLINLYSESIAGNGILDRSTNLNQNLEINVQRVLLLLKNDLDSLTSSSSATDYRKKVLNWNLENATLKTEVFLAHVPFDWDYNLTRMESTEAFHHLVQPLMGIAAELKRHNELLIKCIKKKDSEIEDYKAGGSRLTNKHLETKNFIMSEFLKSTDKIEDVKVCIQGSSENVFAEPVYHSVLTALKCISEDKISHVAPDAESPKRLKTCDTQELPESHETTESDEIARRAELQQLRLVQKKKTKKKLLKL